MEAEVTGAPETAPAAPTSRSLRTRASLRDALAAEVLKVGDLSQVTVTAVSDRAGVTRRTFYSHYRDIADLVSQTEDDALEGLRPLVARIAQSHLDEIEQAIRSFEPIPGSVELLAYCAEHASWLAPLLGEGGDPAFAERLKCLVREVVEPRALEGFTLSAVASLFDYYLTFAVSAEVGVLVRWLTTGAHESAETMARIMCALAFIRPGDLYGQPMDLDLPVLACTLMPRVKGDAHDQDQ